MGMTARSAKIRSRKQTMKKNKVTKIATLVALFLSLTCSGFVRADQTSTCKPSLTLFDYTLMNTNVAKLENNSAIKSQKLITALKTADSVQKNEGDYSAADYILRWVGLGIPNVNPNITQQTLANFLEVPSYTGTTYLSAAESNLNATDSEAMLLLGTIQNSLCVFE